MEPEIADPPPTQAPAQGVTEISGQPLQTGRHLLPIPFLHRMDPDMDRLVAPPELDPGDRDPLQTGIIDIPPQQDRKETVQIGTEAITGGSGAHSVAATSSTS